jgi:hypothetical protein
VTQPRSRRSSIKIVLIVLAAVVVLCCCGGGSGIYLFLDDRTKGARAATEAFLDELESDRIAAAYDRLCASTKRRFEQPAFAEAVGRRKPVSHDLHWGGSFRTTKGVETATVNADMTYQGGVKASHAFPLRKEDGVWKVCGNPY